MVAADKQIPDGSQTLTKWLCLKTGMEGKGVEEPKLSELIFDLYMGVYVYIYMYILYIYIYTI